MKLYLLHTIDTEDLWVNGIPLVVKNHDSYIESFNEVKHVLETPKVIDQVIDEFYLNGNEPDELDYDEIDELYEKHGDNAFDLEFVKVIRPSFDVEYHFRYKYAKDIDYILYLKEEHIPMPINL